MSDFSAINDWVEYLRHCVRDPDSEPELDARTLGVEAGLSKLAGELAATPYGVRLADAAVTLLEQGTTTERAALLQMSLAGAPQLGARLAAIAQAWRGGPLDRRIGTLLLRGLEAAPTDPSLLAALDADAAIDTEHAIADLDRAAPHNVDWVVRHLDLLPRAIDPDGARLAFLALRTLPSDLPRLVDGIEAAGADHVDRFVAALTAPDAPKHLVDRLRPIMSVRPSFAGRLP